MANSTINNSNIWPGLNNIWIPPAPPPTQVSGTSITGGTGFIVPMVSATGEGGGSSLTNIFMTASERNLNLVFTRDYALNVRCTSNLIRHLQKCCYDHYRRNNVKDRNVQETLEMLQNMYQTKPDIIAKQQALLSHLNGSANHSNILRPTQWLKQV